MSARVVLVTGANRGIGYAIIKALVESPYPYHVFLGSRDVEKGKAAAASLNPGNGSSISVVQLDVTSSESIADAVATVKAEAGRVDVLVNNAGIADLNPDPVARLRRLLEVNTIAPYAVTEAFQPLITTQAEDGPKDKRMIYVSSGLGSITERADPKSKYYSVPSVAYRMSKAALNMKAMCDAFELKDHGVKVFAFDPEFVATEFVGTPEERRKRGALEPSVSGESCRDIIEGKRDDQADTFLTINGGQWKW